MGKTRSALATEHVYFNADLTITNAQRAGLVNDEE